MEELFSPQDRDNKYSPNTLETLGVISFKDMIKNIEDKTNAAYKYLSIFGTGYSWEHCSEATKKYMLVKMVTNDLVER